MRALTLEQVLEIYALVSRTTGEDARLRDLGRLESAVATQTQSPFGVELYPNVIDKSAALIRNIISDHVFGDGNNMAAMLTGFTLLEINGLSLEAKTGEIEDLADRIANEKLDVPVIAGWIKTHLST